MRENRQLNLRAGFADLTRREVVRDGVRCPLSGREAELLIYLADRQGRVVSRDELLTEVWRYKAGMQTRTVDVTMRRLREKIEVDAAQPDHLLTRHGDGYTFESLEPVAPDAAPMAPTGHEATLLFTDIQGSTSAWEQFGDGYQAALDAHNTIIRAAIAKHRGYEVKTVGDSFVVAFADPSDAVAAALDMLEGLDGRELGGCGPVRVRIGAHVGPAIARPDHVTGRFDWLGPTVNRAARVAAAAHGGQLLVTQAVRERVAVEGQWTCLGDHVLAGVPGTTRLWEALPLSFGRRSFPPVRSQLRENLPAAPNRFIGRHAELEALSSRFADGERMVTLLGPGGTGKTRLALEHARRSAAPAVWFCDLSTSTTADDVCGAVAACLREPLLDDPVGQVGRLLAGRGRCLLVVDNVEQVVDACAPLLRGWLARAPGLSVLATSRVALHVPGEQVVPTGPLDHSAAVALFLERARAAGAALQAADPDVQHLVTELDHWPLALELAAARTRVVTVAGLRERLNQRFRVLVGGKGERRHHTMQAVLDGSWDALSATDQSALAQLSVFAGGFTLEAAEAVASCDDNLVALERLVDHALVQLNHSSGRFSTLVTVREYASQRLTGAARQEAEVRHGLWFADLARAVAPVDELDNLVLASTRAVGRQDSETAYACAVAACSIFEARGPLSEGLRVARAALALAPGPQRTHLELRTGILLFLAGRVADAEPLLVAAAADPSTAAPAMVALGTLRREQGRSDDARELLAAAASAAAQQNDKTSEAAAWSHLGETYMQSGRPADARQCAERALGLALAASSVVEQARAYTVLTIHHGFFCHPREAQPVFEAASALDGRGRVRRFAAVIAINQALYHMEQGRLAEAEVAAQSSLEMQRLMGRRRGEGVALGVLGYIAVVDGRLPNARLRLSEAIAVDREVGDPRMESHALGFLGLLELAEGQPERAVETLQRGVALARRLADPNILLPNLAFLGQAATEAGDLAAARLALDEATAMIWPGCRPYAVAWVWVARTSLECAVRDWLAAARSLEEAERVGAAVGIGAESDVGRRISALRARLLLL
jgi:class 3 adenylate cyclase/predicted ATPase